MAVTGPGPYRMGMTCGTAQFLTAAMTCGMLGGGTWFEALCHSLAPGCDPGDAELANADWALLKMHGTGTKSA